MIKYLLSGTCRFLAASFDGNFPRAAMFFMRISSELGNAWSQNNLGVKYLSGADVDQDLRRAAVLFTAAADQELVESFLNLAWMYHDGIYFSQDYEASAHWYDLAARKGNAVAKFNLGLMIFNGVGVAQEKEAGLALIIEASNAGVAEATIVIDKIQGYPL